MTLARCVAGDSRTARITIFPLFFLSLFVSIGTAARWDSQEAARAFQLARQKRAELAQLSGATLEQYLECARAYRSVHIKDPHYSRTGDAIYEEALVYQEMADKFSRPEYCKVAARRFHLLVKDYGGNQNCPDALVRLEALYRGALNDENAANEAHRQLRTQYRYSEAAIKRLEARQSSEPKADRLNITAAAAPDSSPAALTSTIQNIRFWSMADYSRVIIDVDSAVKYEQARLSDPERIYFDISNARLSKELVNHSFNFGDEILKNIRAAQKRPNLVRVVLDVSGIGRLAVSELHDPFRIVIDLHRDATSTESATGPGLPAENLPKPQPPSTNSKQDQATAVPVNPVGRREPPKAVTELGTVEGDRKPASTLSSATEVDSEGRSRIAKPTGAIETPAEMASPRLPKPIDAKSADPSAKTTPGAGRDISLAPREAAPTSRGDRTLTRMLGLKVGRIVIDPGHGGHDFGTIGPGGLPEKDLVLALARGLKKMIQEKLGSEVLLTREDDRFISLEERTAIANQHKSDLFISLHANSSRIHTISGVETYYLDFAKTDAEREIAARENATTISNVSDLEDLIKKIAKADKSAESRELASIVQTKLYSGARRVFRSTQNRGVRSAPFIVLIGANMPSVLAEVAFISNPKDERLLGKDATRQNLIRALFSGIEGYMKTLGSDVVQNRTEKSK